MDRLKLGHDLEVSRLVYGLWRLADDRDTWPAHVRRKIEACLEQGVTTMDHADIYGGYTGEEIFGNALRAAPSLRDRLEIVTKCGIVMPRGATPRPVSNITTRAVRTSAPRWTPRCH